MREFQVAGKVVVFVCKGPDLSSAEAQLLWNRMGQLEREISGEFQRISIEVVYKPCEILTPQDRTAIWVAGQNCPRPTVLVVFLTGEQKPTTETVTDKSILGMTAASGSSVIFVDHLKRGVKNADELIFRIGQVTAHEIGHALRFEFYGTFEGLMKRLFSDKTLTMEGRGIPRARRHSTPAMRSLHGRSGWCETTRVAAPEWSSRLSTQRRMAIY